MKSNEKLDKDRFRRDLGGEAEAYQEVARRLGLLPEGEATAVLDLDSTARSAGNRASARATRQRAERISVTRGSRHLFRFARRDVKKAPPSRRGLRAFEASPSLEVGQRGRGRAADGDRALRAARLFADCMKGIGLTARPSMRTS